MPFGTGLPPENLDPWYTSMSNSWSAMTSFVNGLETAIGLRVTTATYTAAMALKADLVGGLIPTNQLPPLAINEVFTPANQTARLNLTAQRGDMAIQIDNGLTYVLASDSPSTNADWKVISAAGGVTSVAGKTGTVALAPADVVGLTGLLDAKAPLASPALTGTPTAPTQSVGNNSTRLATTAFVAAAIADAPAAAGTTLDIMYEDGAYDVPTAPAGTLVRMFYGPEVYQGPTVAGIVDVWRRTALT